MPINIKCLILVYTAFWLRFQPKISQNTKHAENIKNKNAYLYWILRLIRCLENTLGTQLVLVNLVRFGGIDEA